MRIRSEEAEQTGLSKGFDIGHTSMEKAMAPHSSTLAWKIPWMKDPGGAVHGVAES